MFFRSFQPRTDQSTLYQPSLPFIKKYVLKHFKSIYGVFSMKYFKYVSSVS